MEGGKGGRSPVQGEMDKKKPIAATVAANDGQSQVGQGHDGGPGPPRGLHAAAFGQEIQDQGDDGENENDQGKNNAHVRSSRRVEQPRGQGSLRNLEGGGADVLLKGVGDLVGLLVTGFPWHGLVLGNLPR